MSRSNEDIFEKTRYGTEFKELIEIAKKYYPYPIGEVNFTNVARVSMDEAAEWEKKGVVFIGSNFVTGEKTSTSYALLKDQNGNNVKDLTERGNEKLNIYINFNEEIVDKYERYFFKDDYSKFQKQDKFNYYQNLKEIIGDFGTIKSKDMNDYDKKLLSEFIMAHELGHSFFSKIRKGNM